MTEFMPYVKLNHEDHLNGKYTSYLEIFRGNSTIGDFFTGL